MLTFYKLYLNVHKTGFVWFKQFYLYLQFIGIGKHPKIVSQLNISRCIVETFLILGSKFINSSYGVFPA